MMQLNRFLAVLVTLTGFVVPDAAGESLIEPVSQSRSIFAQALTTGGPPGGYADTASDSATDFGPFQSTVEASDESYTAFADTMASQDSVILPDGISAEGRVYGYGCGESLVGTGAEGQGRSTCIVVFTLESDAHYAATGLLYGVGGTTEVRLEEEGGPIVFSAVSAAFGTPLSASGILLAGTYRFTAESDDHDGGTCYSISASFSVDLRFTRIGAPTIAPVVDDRTLDVLAMVDGPSTNDVESDSDSAPFGEAYDDNVFKLAWTSEGSATSAAEQDSRILLDGLELAGSAGVTGCIDGAEGTVSGSASSNVDLIFSVTADADFHATGSVDASGGGDVTLRMRPVGGPLLFEYTVSGSGMLDVAETGTLPAGNYRLILAAAVDDVGLCIDETASFSVDLALTEAEIGTRICSPAVPNSTGEPGVVRVQGSPVVAEDRLTLVAERLPTNSNIGYFIMGTGTNTITPPGSAGPICILPGLARLKPPVSNTNELPGGFCRSIGTSGPVSSLITPGSTWSFQAWHRDSMAGTSNLTDAVSVAFQ